jgi:hypothetical protein
VDHLGLVKTVDRLGQGVVIAVADTPDRWLDPDLGQTLGILDRDILAAAVAVMDEATTMNGPPIMDRLFQGIEHEAGVCRSADPPAHDIAGVDIDYEGYINEAGPRREWSRKRMSASPHHPFRRGLLGRGFFQGGLGLHLRPFVTTTKPQSSLNHNLKSVPLVLTGDSRGAG